jgi:hypothetical protein
MNELQADLFLVARMALPAVPALIVGWEPLVCLALEDVV